MRRKKGTTEISTPTRTDLSEREQKNNFKKSKKSYVIYGGGNSLERFKVIGLRMNMNKGNREEKVVKHR